jgi:hypothetical protein
MFAAYLLIYTHERHDALTDFARSLVSASRFLGADRVWIDLDL